MVQSLLTNKIVQIEQKYWPKIIVFCQKLIHSLQNKKNIIQRVSKLFVAFEEK